jgi:hypothetical protein
MRAHLITAAAASVVLHGLLFGALALISEPSEPPTPPAAAPDPADPTPPLEIVAIDLAPVPEPRRAPEPAPASPPSPEADSTGEAPPKPRPATAPPSPSGEAESRALAHAEPPPSSVSPGAPPGEMDPLRSLGMRAAPAGESPGIVLDPRHIVERIEGGGAASSRELLPPPGGPPTGETPPDFALHPTGDGGYIAQTSVFRARIHRDGSVSFDDKRSIGFGGFGRGETPSTGSRTEADGAAGGFPDVSNLPTVRVRFDLNDMLMRAAGGDPYDARKRQFLEATREQRLAMARAARRDDLARSTSQVRAHLESVWRDVSPSTERRRLIFELWDEAAEEGPEEVVRAARTVRATIEAFVRRELPRDSAHAYSETELRELNATRASRARFDPYAESDG